MTRDEEHDVIGLADGPPSEAEAASEAADRARRELEMAKGRERHLAGEVEKLEERLLELETRLAQAELERHRALDEARELRATLSWRITAPLRKISGLTGRR